MMWSRSARGRRSSGGSIHWSRTSGAQYGKSRAALNIVLIKRRSVFLTTPHGLRCRGARRDMIIARDGTTGRAGDIYSSPDQRTLAGGSFASFARSTVAAGGINFAMIFYLVTREHRYTFAEYLDTWGRENRGRMRPLFYDSVFRSRNLPRGTYIFSDLERLNAAQLELAGMLYRAMSAAGEGIQLLNNPANVLRREALLRELHRVGANPFAVYRSGENLNGLRFPRSSVGRARTMAA